jgi:hypothetical protein
MASRRNESPEEYRRGVEASMAAGVESLIISESYAARSLAVPGTRDAAPR